MSDLSSATARAPVPRPGAYPRAERDWYCEPPWIVDALLDVEPFFGAVWDPACGSGNIPRLCALRGLDAKASDLFDCYQPGVRFDFLNGEPLPFSRCNIITNPPFREIEPFLLRALAIAPWKVAILARLAFLEGQKRRELFETTPLARVWVSSRRVSMPPGGSGIPAKGGAVAFAWFVWEHGHRGPAQVGWV